MEVVSVSDTGLAEAPETEALDLGVRWAVHLIQIKGQTIKIKG